MPALFCDYVRRFVAARNESGEARQCPAAPLLSNSVDPVSNLHDRDNDGASK